MSEVRAATERSNPTSKEQRLRGHRRAKRSYVLEHSLNMSLNMLLHVQGREGQLVQDKEQRLCFAGAAVKKHPRSKVRETQVRW